MWIAWLSLLFTISQATDRCVPMGNDCIPFGHQTRDKVFMMDSKGVMINHGSYGGTPRVLFDTEIDWMKQMESNTFYWFLPGMGYRLYLSEVRTKLAEYVGVKPEDLVMVENASSGVNAVLRSLFPSVLSGTKVLRLSLAYPMVQHTVSYVSSAGHLDDVVVDVPLPTNQQIIIDKVNATFKQYAYGEIGVAVFSHIVSMPAAILPIKELIQIARAHGALVLVDGAHAVGQVPLNLTELDPDFYTSNGHKWLCSPKGSAFLYVKNKHRDIIHPTVISNQFGNGWDLVHQFEYTGTRDYSAFLTVQKALEWRKNMTDETVMGYNNELCLAAAKMMSKAWNTTRPIPDSMAASIINVLIPCNSKDPAYCYTWDEPEMYLWLFAQNIWALVFPDQAGLMYVRLSCQIYNEMADYIALMNAIDQFNIRK